MPSSHNNAIFTGRPWASWRVAWLYLVMIPLYSPNYAAQVFPEWTVRPIGLVGTWESAPAMVIAELRNVKPVGVQKLTQPPRWPASASIQHIYWCEGDFVASLAVRGRLPVAGRKFLWGQIREGCDIIQSWDMPDPGPTIRVWFIREEGEYIRPVADAGGVFFAAFKAQWRGDPELDPQTRFTQLLLTAGRLGRDLPKHQVDEILATACLILGRHSEEPEAGERCTEQFDALMRLEPHLRPAICEFRRTMLQQPCIDGTEGIK